MHKLRWSLSRWSTEKYFFALFVWRSALIDHVAAHKCLLSLDVCDCNHDLYHRLFLHEIKFYDSFNCIIYERPLFNLARFDQLMKTLGKSHH